MSGVLRTVASVAGVVSTIAALTGNAPVAAVAGLVSGISSPVAPVLARKPKRKANRR